MKKTIKLFMLLVICIIAIIAMTGCGEKSTTVTYDSETATISLSYPETAGYTYTENKDELKSTMNVAGIIAENFEIDIRVERLGVLNFQELVDKRLDTYGDREEFPARKITVAGQETVELYYNNYVSLLFPSTDKECFEVLVYGDGFSNEKIKAAYDLPEVQEILKTIVVKVK